MSTFLVLHTAVTSSPERFGNLHRKRPHTTTRTINQHLLSGLNLSFRAQALQGGDCRERDGRCFLECHIGWFQRQCIFTRTHILGKSAKPYLVKSPNISSPG